MSQTLGRPSLTVAMAGMPLPPAVAAKVTYVVVQQLLGLPAAAEIDLAVAEADLLDIVAKGRTITLRVGDETLFDGRIEAVTYSQDVARGQVLQLRAHDALSSARRRCAMVARENASSATLGAEIAGRLGLDFRCDADPAIRPLLFQTGQSELDLLVRVAAEDGLYPVVTAGTLRLTSLEGWGTPLTLRLGRGLHRLRIGSSDETAVSRVDMLGWRSDSLEALRGIAGDRALPLGEDAVRFLPDRMLGGGPQGQALAQATMDRAQAAGTTAEGLADGNPALAPGCRILIKAPMADRDGPFVVTRAVHRFTTTEGYTTEFGTAPPPARDRERRPVVTIGRVSSISDPDEAGRCRARLPGFADLESGWLQLVVPGAGKGRGLACLPEVEDAVLILLPDGDPAQGFVLGGLWGRDRLPRGVNLKQKRPFVLRTAGGQGLELGHDAALARLSTASGSVVELAPNRLRIAAATDLLIEAPGKSVTIRANAINFEQA